MRIRVRSYLRVCLCVPVTVIICVHLIMHLFVGIRGVRGGACMCLCLHVCLCVFVCLHLSRMVYNDHRHRRLHILFLNGSLRMLQEIRVLTLPAPARTASTRFVVWQQYTDGYGGNAEWVRVRFLCIIHLYMYVF